jgi:response regulator RpfG family c-di-GMP phosphodiesterase
VGWQEFRKTGKVKQDKQQDKLSLLIVDDETGIITSLEEGFRTAFKVYTANSAQEALQAFRDHEVHIVLSDQRMPGMTGVEMLEKMKKINDLPVRILITGYSDINVVIRGLNDGLIWKYVTKPWKWEDLKALIRQAARKYARDAELDDPKFRILGL